MIIVLGYAALANERTQEGIARRHEGGLLNQDYTKRAPEIALQGSH